MKDRRILHGTLTSGALLAAGALVAFTVGGTARASAADKTAGAEPKLVLRASPNVSFAPAEISVQATLEGGSDHDQTYYCPSVEWNWGDGTTSEASADCEPYQQGKSEIDRHYFIRHTYQNAGRYRVALSLKKKDGKRLTTASTEVIVRPGLGG